ncbi:trafficking protein particle complex subunit 11 isoform X2 [Ricinus communis]|uniref:trafficking protein particle complex subunit 11 isoform X2 n=1 Tax=Ricinus communis TaxID=3988 RepID=UPI00077279A7|nr:trafficking protein particle complex subunit 11 isoform X2 [Ricinus communis]
MEEYPEELRTPPVSLIALVGCGEHHPVISTHLLAEQPPMNTLALPDLSKISLLLNSFSDRNLPPTAGGIIKRDWLLKHRTKVPSVVASLFTSDHVSGDPAQWLQLCSDLEDLKTLIRPKSIKLVVIVVHSSPVDDINEDRINALRKRAELDSKSLILFNPADSVRLKQSLNKLGSIFAELANTYYRDEGRRIKTRVEKKSFNSHELNIRYCFKVAVYAEFRRDWAEALKFYEDAYHILREMVATTNRLPVIQRLVEIKTVAEQLHFKISTLLLHGGKVIEAITWFRQHIASYKKLLGAAEVIFLHWEWMSRQFLVFAELLETSSKALTSPTSPTLATADRSLTEWEFQPAYYYQLAGHYLKEKRTSLELALSMLQTADETDGRAESVEPSIYVGQFARLADEEYTYYAISEGKRFQDSFEIIALLKRSYDSYINLKAQRMASLCGFQMAREYFSVGDLKNAKFFFDSVAVLYRQEGWVTLLWEVLGFLRECSRKCGIVEEFIEYSLEMAALPISSGTGIQSFRSKEFGPAGPASLEQKEIIHKEVFQLVNGETGLMSVDDNGILHVNRDNPLHLEIDLVSPLRMVLLASVAFHEQIIKPGVPTLLTLSLLSQLPVTIDIDQVEVQFNQSDCNFIILNSQKPPSAAMSIGLQGRRTETAPSLALVTNKWLRLTYAITSEQSGKLECIYVVAKMGPHFTICCRAENPASMDDLPLWKFEDRVETFPIKDPALAFSGQKVAQVEEPDPQVDLILGATGPALVGECFVIPVTVASKGHSVFSGELKINLVDVRGGGLFSPREAEPFSMDSHHVELLGVSGPEGEGESQTGPDKIIKIQQSFGLISVPFLQDGESWSCKLEIKWHRPKPIMLFVSLGYFPDNNEMTSQKVHVHKSLQIEGKNALLISHQFMLPFRQDPLLLSKLKPNPNSDQSASLPLNETSVLVVSAKNCSEVPLQLQSMSIEVDDDTERLFSLQHSGEDLLGPACLVPGEEFKKVFTVIPEVESSNVNLGSVSLKWRRDSQNKDQLHSATEAWVSTRHKLPDVNVELSPLVLIVECPPYAILGDPFTYSVKIRNQTPLLQELNFSLADVQSFVLAGSHSDTVFVLPKSEHLLGYKIVPLASGLQQLPRVTVTSVRYSAGFQPSTAAATVFVFPSKPCVDMADMGDREIESLVAE